jgi:hypothetical protein
MLHTRRVNLRARLEQLEAQIMLMRNNNSIAVMLRFATETLTLSKLKRSTIIIAYRLDLFSIYIYLTRPILAVASVSPNYSNSITAPFYYIVVISTMAKLCASNGALYTNT